MDIDVTWLGHAAFLLTAGGTRLLLDPYDAAHAGTYAPITVETDAVFVSHENAKYHSYWAAARGEPERVNGLDLLPHETRTVGNFALRAVHVWESAARDVPVSMPCVSVNGLNICHSGDLGHALSDAEVAAVGPCDVFLAVAGGPPTLDLAYLKSAIDRIKPRIVIPMHFGNGKTNLSLLPVEQFLALFDPAQVTFAPTPTLTVSCDTLPARTTVVVLPPAC